MSAEYAGRKAMSKVYVFLADGFEEIEGLTVVDLLRRAGEDVVTVSIMGRKMIEGSHKIKVEADALFEKTNFTEGKMLVLPGGMPGTKYLGAHKPLTDMLCDWDARGKQLAAICAAPSVFGDLGILKGKEAVCYPGFEDQLKGAEYTAALCTVDGNIITGKGPGASFEYGYTLVTLLKGERVAEALKKGMMYEG